MSVPLSTTEIACNIDAKGFEENKYIAVEEGTIAGNARVELEKKFGRIVVSKENYKELTEMRRWKLKSGKE